MATYKIANTLASRPIPLTSVSESPHQRGSILKAKVAELERKVK